MFEAKRLRTAEEGDACAIDLEAIRSLDIMPWRGVATIASAQRTEPLEGDTSPSSDGIDEFRLFPVVDVESGSGQARIGVFDALRLRRGEGFGGGLSDGQ